MNTELRNKAENWLRENTFLIDDHVEDYEGCENVTIPSMKASVLIDMLEKCAQSIITTHMEQEDVWVSVEDRLPEEGCQVVVWMPEVEGFRTAYLKNNDWQEWPEGWNVEDKISHWRPLFINSPTNKATRGGA